MKIIGTIFKGESNVSIPSLYMDLQSYTQFCVINTILTSNFQFPPNNERTTCEEIIDSIKIGHQHTPTIFFTKGYPIYIDICLFVIYGVNVINVL